MRKLSYATIGICCLLLFSNSMVNAQREGKKFSVGFGLEGGIPTGDSKISYNSTGGLTIRLSHLAGPGFFTLTSGALLWLPKTNAGLDTKASIQIPVLAGYKYVFHKPFFVMGEVGYSSFKVYYKDPNGTGTVASSSSGGFTYAPTVGVNFNAFEFGIKYEATSLSGGTASDVGIRLGFNF